MQIAPNLIMLEINQTMLGRSQTLYPTLFWDGASALLVDTGLPGQQLLLADALKQEGVPIEKLQTIVLTHQDVDHIGGAPALVELAAHPVTVMAHAAEKPYIEGDRPLIKMTPERVAQVVAGLPPDWPEERRAAVKNGLEHPPRSHIDRTLADGEELPIFGGIRVIGTPGHTPGHISLYHAPSRTLISGDALNTTGGELNLPRPEICSDFPLAVKSLDNLAAYPIAQVICFHGGLYARDVNARLAELARGRG